jgi:hypothetical protein
MNWKKMRPLYFMVGFWGDKFRGYFSDYCLPSLLVPGNLKALSCTDGHKFLIATTRHDWAELQLCPLWAELCEHAEPVLIEVGLPEDSSEAAKFRHMSLGHRLMVNVAIAEQALACQIMPDAMYTNGTVSTILRHAAQGARAVLTVAMRLKEELLFTGLKERNLLPALSRSQPIHLRSRDVVDIAIASLHDDCGLHDWDGSRFPIFPGFSFWRVRNDLGIIIQSAYYAYILLDMAAIEQHNERSFDDACIENHWLSDNFPDPSRVRIVQDSDDALVISWTPSSERGSIPATARVARLRSIAPVWKGYRMRCMREYHLKLGDVQKANNIRYPIYWHTAAAGDGWRDTAEWRDAEARVRRIMFIFFGDLFSDFLKSGHFRLTVLLVPWWNILRIGVRAAPFMGKLWAVGCTAWRAIRGSEAELALLKRKVGLRDTRSAEAPDA